MEGFKEISAAIFLGAGEYPREKDFNNVAFRRSKTDFEDYLRADLPRGLGVRSAAVLDLFGLRYSPSDYLSEIGGFLRGLKSAYPTCQRNLIIYYVGHGYFGDDQKYYLALSSYDPEQRDATGLSVAQLATTIKRFRDSFRAFYILDCCFAGEALRQIQGDPAAVAQLAAKELRVDAPRNDSMLPRFGSALLCAASKDDVARAPEQLQRTVFSEALLNVLTHGDPESSQTLTLEKIKDLIWARIQETHSDKKEYQVRPSIHAPDQSDGDVSKKVALFPNPGYVRADTLASVPEGPGTVPSPSELSLRFTGLLKELRKQLTTDGVFNLDWSHAQTHPPSHQDEELASEGYLFRLFIQKLLFAASKVHPRAVGSANAWVCHKALESSDANKRPRYLRSGEREGYFRIDQLVTKGMYWVRYRTNEVIYDECHFEFLSVASQAIVKGDIQFLAVEEAGYVSDAEKNSGITHILGIPLYKPEHLNDEMDGVPMAITVDFDFGRQPVAAAQIEIERNARELMKVFQLFCTKWLGTRTLQHARTGSLEV